jgi:hypothetical protein
MAEPTATETLSHFRFQVSSFIDFLLTALLTALREAAAVESSGTKSALSQHQVEILRLSPPLTNW